MLVHRDMGEPGAGRHLTSDGCHTRGVMGKREEMAKGVRGGETGIV
jgi:hypothetical protein